MHLRCVNGVSVDGSCGVVGYGVGQCWGCWVTVAINNLRRGCGGTVPVGVLGWFGFRLWCRGLGRL